MNPTSRGATRFQENRRWIVWLAVAQAAAFLYFWLAWGSFQGFVEAVDHHPQFMQDFVGYYYPMSRQLFESPAPIFGYVYSSFFALLLTPIGMLPLAAAMVTWAGLQVAGFIGLCLFALRGFGRASGRDAILSIALCTTSFPVLHNFKWGQVSLFITLCVIGAFVLANERKSAWAGALLAFAAAIKFYPALFAVYFLLRRDVRAIVSFVAAGLVFYVAIPVAFLGVSNWLAFEKTVGASIEGATWLAQAVNSQYVVHVGLRWWQVLVGQVPPDLFAQGLAVLGYAVALACFGLAWLLQRKLDVRNQVLSMVAIFMAVPFLIKTSWPHYFVHLPLCQLAVLSYYRPSYHSLTARGKILGALPVVSMALSSVFVFNLFPHWSYYSGFGVLFFANLLLLISLTGVVALPTAPEAHLRPADAFP